MAMEKIYRCDKCEKIVSSDEDLINITFNQWIEKGRFNDTTSFLERTNVDWCFECSEEIKTILQGEE